MLSVVYRLFSRALFISACAVIMLLLGILAYAEISLPKGVDERPFGVLEGQLGGDPKLQLISTTTATREGRRLVVLAQNWVYIAYEMSADGEQFALPIEISRYFASDFASVPPPFNRIINPFGKHAEAAIVHDWLYALGEENERHLADRVFYDAMRQSGVPWLRRRLMYAAVRLGGAAAYGRQNEWDEGFYDSYTNALMPKACLIKKPKLENFVFPSVISAPLRQELSNFRDDSFFNLNYWRLPESERKKLIAELKDEAGWDDLKLELLLELYDHRVHEEKSVNMAEAVRRGNGMTLERAWLEIIANKRECVERLLANYADDYQARPSYTKFFDGTLNGVPAPNEINMTREVWSDTILANVIGNNIEPTKHAIYVEMWKQPIYRNYMKAAATEYKHDLQVLISYSCARLDVGGYLSSTERALTAHCAQER